MIARSHVVLGLAAWVVAAPALHLRVLDPVSIALAMLGALLPDIDHPSSWAGRRTRPLSTVIAASLGHRGVTHSAIAVIGVTGLLLHARYQRAAVDSLAVGYLSHLAADVLTPRGLRLMWPLGGTWCLPLCRTGSAMENAVVCALVAAAAWWRLR